MNMWSSFKKWALRGNPLAEPYIAPRDTPRVTPCVEPRVSRYDEMVGEPVISFIESLHRERGRRYTFSSITAAEYTGQKHYWMGERGFFKMVDKKTNLVYHGLTYDYRLYTIVGLPFDLNGWELKALFEAFMAYRQPVVERYHSMVSRRQQRLWKQARSQELLNRAAFAKQFQE